MTKGEDTKTKILDKGVELVTQLGLECLSIGTLAKATGMSKSGLFAHFQSKENLQLAVMEYAGCSFADSVAGPALKTMAGIPRVKKLVDNWILWTEELAGGCLFIAASSEYSDRPGKVRDSLIDQQDQWIDCLLRIGESAIKAGDFKKDADCSQFAYDLYSLMLGFHLYNNTLKDPKSKKWLESSFTRLLNHYKT